MLLGALPVIRRQGFFEMFYWTHLNYITFSVLYCLHSPAGLIWFLVPGAVFLLYKLSVFVRLCLGLRSSVALECTALPVQGDQARDGEKILLSCGRLCLHQYSSDQQVYASVSEVAFY